MRRLSLLKICIALVLVMVVAATIWLAAPLTAFPGSTTTSSAVSSPTDILRQAYLPPGEILIQKIDRQTGLPINSAGPPWMMFRISPNPYDLLNPAPLIVTDNTAPDANNTPGQILLQNVPIGTYTITETVAPPHYMVDSAPMNVNVISNQRVPVTFFDIRLGQIIIEKRDRITGEIITTPGPPWVTFTISPNPYDLGSGTPLTVADNGPYDSNPAVGRILVEDVPPFTYTIIEVVAPPGYLVDTTPIVVGVTPGGTATAVSRDMPIEKIPASSPLGTWIMIGAFAVLIGGFILWKRHSATKNGTSGTSK